MDLSAVPHRVHRPPPRQLLIAVAINAAVLLMCFGPLVIILAGGLARGLWLFALSFGVMAAYFLFLASRVRFVTSPEGIDYHQFGYHISASWEDVEAVVKVQRGIAEREGLRLREAARTTSFWYRLFRNMGSAKERQRNHFIPLTPLMRDWRASSLGRDIRQYAPHLFDDRVEGEILQGAADFMAE